MEVVKEIVYDYLINFNAYSRFLDVVTRNIFRFCEQKGKNMLKYV